MKIYADNAATTKMCPAAIEAMLPFLDRIYGNPSSLHSVGQEAAEALADAVSGPTPGRSYSLQAAARRTTRRSSPPHGWGGSRAGSISYPPHSSITLSCTPWRS